MTTEQIYTLVNEVNAEAFGSNALSVVDTSSLISLGNTVLSSSTNTEAFLNTLAMRIGRTILRFRDYRNKLGDMVLNDFEYGAILQKIKVVMPQAEADERYGLTDGQSVDHYVVAKPVVDQKLFVTRTPYQFHITIQRSTLKEAFLSESAMGAFIGVVFGEVRNALEVSLENLGRVTLATAIAECDNTTRTIDLRTMFNTAYSASYSVEDFVATPDCMRFAMKVINNVIDSMQDMSVLYNNGSFETFTPKEDMRCKMISLFKRALETSVEYAAFHDQFVRPDIDVTTINYWQASQPGSQLSVDITRPSDGTTVQVDNVVAIIHDRDAFGVYKIDEEVLTSPVNAAGSYYNTYWHEQQLRFIDLSENFVVFTLN